MTPKQKQDFLAEYLRLGSQKPAFTAAGIYYAIFDRERDKDPLFKRDVKEVHELINARAIVRAMLYNTKRRTGTHQGNMDVTKKIFLDTFNGSVSETCDNAGITRTHYYNMRKDDPEFSKMVDEKKEAFGIKVVKQEVRETLPSVGWIPVSIQPRRNW